MGGVSSVEDILVSGYLPMISEQNCSFLDTEVFLEKC